MFKKKYRWEAGRKNRQENGSKLHIGAVKPAVWLFLTLLLAALFILLSLFFVRKLIKARENNLLAGKGTIKQDSPVRVGMMQEKGEKVVLTTEEVQAIIENWNRRIGLLVHEPVEGQISMGDAVKAVDEWLPKMGISEGILSGNSAVYSSLNIARIKGEKTEMVSPTYSFWEVSVAGDELNGEFYVNAVTGQIFEVYITLFPENVSVTREQLLKSFIRLAGLKQEEQKKGDDLSEIIEQGGKNVVLSGSILLGISAWTEELEKEAALKSSSGTNSSTDAGVAGEDWHISAGIADSSMVAQVNCFHYWRYEAQGVELDDQDGKTATAQLHSVDLAFNFYVKE